MTEWRKLKGKKVVVEAGGIEYHGTVVELGERSLLLRGSSGHREIPWERITRVREETGGGRGLGRSVLG